MVGPVVTYAIGDVQGCFFSLQALLNTLDFSPSRDTLWFAGDLINRGPHSLKTARFVQSLGNSALCVLGNHDLALLAIGYKAVIGPPPKHTFQDILEAPDKNSLLEWFRAMPLIHVANHHLLVHAGLYPFWSIEKAIQLANEITSVLQGTDYFEFLAHFFADHPHTWQDALSGIDRSRFIVNAFTRMRYCSVNGMLDLKTKEQMAQTPEGCRPWFELLSSSYAHHQILFGHWSDLNGQCAIPNVHALDTGCAWNNHLTALNIHTLERISVPCSPQDQKSLS